jgi:hypothetical protein
MERGVRRAECSRWGRCSLPGHRKGTREHVSPDEDSESCKSGMSKRGDKKMVSYDDMKEEDDETGNYLVEVPRIEAQVRLAGGMRAPVIDTAAYNIWMDEAIFSAANVYELCPDQFGAKVVDGSSQAVLGAGKIKLTYGGNCLHVLQIAS